jgi:hypothetical protein
MRKKQSIDILPAHAQLREPLQGAPSCIEEKFPLAGFDQDTRTEPVHYRWGGSRPQQRYFNALAVRELHRQSKSDEDKRTASSKREHVVLQKRKCQPQNTLTGPPTDLARAAR